MPITKSTLEQKWYFRVAKVAFLILPPVGLVFLLIKTGFPFAALSQKTVSDFVAFNSNGMVLAVLAAVVYYVLLNFVWRIFLYIVFGGLINDTRKAPSQAATPSEQRGNADKNNTDAGFILFALIIVALMYWIYNYQPLGNSAAKNASTNRNNNSTCISTGCGNLWRCDGSYYVEDRRLDVHACLPRKASEIYSGWTGTCRQCP